MRLGKRVLLIIALIASAQVWSFNAGSSVNNAAPATRHHLPRCLRRVATIRGSNGDNFLLGTNSNDVIWAGKGADIIFSGPGDDKLCGGKGDDQLFGGDGFDKLSGGAGTDVCDGERRKKCET